MEVKKETWMTIKHHDNYEVSDLGNVRNKKTKRILKPAISNKGYYLVSLSRNCKQHTYTIHKLVMEHFDRCAFDYEVINHKDHDKLNNNIDNLEYITQKENCIKSVEFGNTKTKPIIQYNLSNDFIKTYQSIIEAHRQTKISLGDICKCCQGKRKSAGGYIWKYN